MCASALIVLLLVGLRVLSAVAVTGVVAMLSTACYLYRRRSV
jgi:hypothetical protein